MRRRSGRRGEEGHINHERWLVSYADFITLLFAFFVVLYAASSINETKYRSVSEILQATFSTPPKSIAPIQVGEIAQSLEENKGGTNVDPLDQIASELEKQFEGLIKADLVKIKKTDQWIELEIKSNVLFLSASASLLEGAKPYANLLADTLKKVDAPITVEGFTDNVPINNELYPSNWELSTARASAMVRYLIEQGVDSKHLAAVGFAENFPESSNDTEEGRSRNRRVIFLISRIEDRKETLNQTSLKSMISHSQLPQSKEHGK